MALQHRRRACLGAGVRGGDDRPDAEGRAPVGDDDESRLGGIFDTLMSLVRRGLGGRAGDGRQFISWIHHEDFVQAIRWLLDHDEIAGVVNVASPNPLPNAEFMRTLRHAAGVTIGLPREPLDARNRRGVHADGDRADSEEPARRPNAAARARLRVQIPAVAGRGTRSLSTMAVVSVVAKAHTVPLTD